VNILERTTGLVRIPKLRVTGVSGGRGQLLRLKAVHADHIICRTYSCKVFTAGQINGVPIKQNGTSLVTSLTPVLLGDYEGLQFRFVTSNREYRIVGVTPLFVCLLSGDASGEFFNDVFQIIQWTEGSTDIIVAKPWRLRRSPFDKQTYDGVAYEYHDGHVTRKGTLGVYVYEECLIPAYVIGELLLCFPTTDGGTCLFVNGAPSQWLQETDRAWALRWNYPIVVP
jgi:hypothetical protein